MRHEKAPDRLARHGFSPCGLFAVTFKAQRCNMWCATAPWPLTASRQTQQFPFGPRTCRPVGVAPPHPARGIGVRGCRGKTADGDGVSGRARRWVRLAFGATALLVM